MAGKGGCVFVFERQEVRFVVCGLVNFEWKCGCYSKFHISSYFIMVVYRFIQ